MMRGAPEPKLEHLYQEVILDHNKNPRNFKELPDATEYSHGVNPLCGDNYHLYLKVDKGQIQDIGFTGMGCAISKASASMMTTLVKGKPVEEAEKLKTNFLDMMTLETVPPNIKSEAGRMVMFQGVREFPVRVKCATLIWHALNDALKDAKKNQ